MIPRPVPLRWILVGCAAAVACSMDPAGPAERGRSLSPAVSDGTRIAFVRESGGQADIHVMDSDGTNASLVSEEPGFVLGLDWLPDGSGLVFQSRRDVPGGIYRMDLDGTNVQRVSPLGMHGNYHSVSPDGARIAFSSFDGLQYDVWLIDLAEYPDNAGSLVQLTTSPAFDLYPAWSPDGSRIAFSSNRSGTFDIWVVDADETGSPVQKTASPWSDALPVWSPDGRIGFTRFPSNAFVSEMYVMDAAGFELNLTLLEDGYAAPERPVLDGWSPDGDRIVFASDRDGDYDIYVMDEVGGVTSNLVQLTHDPALDGFAAWGVEFTAEAAVIALQSSVEGLVASGELAEEDAQPLLVGLENALLLLGDGPAASALVAAAASPRDASLRAAIQQLASVANKVRGLVRSRRLDGVIADELLGDIATAVELIEEDL